MKSLKNYPLKPKSPLPQIPEEAGVYLFRNSRGTVLYVGKAKNLKRRLASYFAGQLLPKTRKLLNNAATVSFVPVAYEMEALLLEAALIKKFQPKYNIVLKDDKSELYVAITKETYPRVLTLRKTQINQYQTLALFGPFAKATEIKNLLKKIRKAISFSTHKPGKRACLENQIHLCSPCPSEIEQTKDLKEKRRLLSIYKHHVKQIRKLLSGSLKIVRRDLVSQMMKAANSEDYHQANLIKKQIQQLDQIVNTKDIAGDYYQNPNLLEDIRQKELKSLTHLLKPYLKLKKLHRIECFDVAHLASTQPTASMVVLIDGQTDKKSYRHFKIRTQLKGDTDRLAEVIKRRLKHLKDWGEPDLIIVDGGKPQVGICTQVLIEKNSTVPLIGLAKREEKIIIKKETVFAEIKPQEEALHLLQRARDEAHRFAQRYHHKLVSAIFKE